MKSQRPLIILLLVLASAFVAGCNLFGGLNTPSTDPQLLSAARASFDKGDFASALNFYQKLSSSQTDIANSESAMTVLDQNGVGMANYISSFGQSTSNVGAAITSMSNMLINRNPNSTLRLGVFGAYQYINSTTIKDNSLRGLVRFLTSVGILAELFAEAATNGQVHKTDISAAAGTCTASAGACVTCSGAGSKIADGGQSATTPGMLTVSDFNATTATLTMIDAAIKEINLALGSTELSGTGNFSASNINFFNPTQTAVGNNCYRYALMTSGIGI